MVQGRCPPGSCPLAAAPGAAPAVLHTRCPPFVFLSGIISSAIVSFDYYRDYRAICESKDEISMAKFKGLQNV